MSIAIVVSAAALSLVCVAGWWQQCRTRDASHVDVIWAYGVGATSLFYLVIGDGDVWRRALAAILIVIWSARLGGHIWSRHGGEEDGRYRAMRERLGARINSFHFFFFQVQGLLAWTFALPLLVIASHPGGVSPVWALTGFVLGALALGGESLADRQLQAWRADPANRGRTCRVGLWRYSRHPNYFFEWLHWFSYPLIAVGAPAAAWLWLAPVSMFLFLWFVTGIPYTEQQALRSRGEDYRAYQRSTSVFFPWRPKT